MTKFIYTYPSLYIIIMSYTLVSIGSEKFLNVINIEFDYTYHGCILTVNYTNKNIHSKRNCGYKI